MPPSDPTAVPLDKHFDARLEAVADLFKARLQAFEASCAKCEAAWQQRHAEAFAALSKLEANAKAALDKAEADAKERTITAERTLTDKLGHMNEFRSQIEAERSSYVTKDELTLRLAPLLAAGQRFGGVYAAVAGIVAFALTVIGLLIAWARK